MGSKRNRSRRERRIKVMADAIVDMVRHEETRDLRGDTKAGAESHSDWVVSNSTGRGICTTMFDADRYFGVNKSNPEGWTRVIHSVDADRQISNRSGWKQKRIDQEIFEGKR